MKIDQKKIYVTFSLTALGIAIGSLVSFLKLPVFLDTIGIMLTTILLGWRFGILSSLLTAVVAFFLISPYVPFYFLTMLGLVAYTEYAYRKGWYATFTKSTIAGIVHGIIGTLLSLPVTYFLFDGFTASGNDLVVAFLVSKGLVLIVSVLISLLIFAVIDRILTCWFSHYVVKMFPYSFTSKHNFRNLMNESLN